MVKTPSPTKNGSILPTDMGMLRQPLDKPETVATLSVAEASEIKERKRLIENEMQKFNDFQKIISLLRSEQTRYLQGLIQAKGLSLTDDYNVDSEAGAILLVARNIDPAAMESPPIDPEKE